MSKHGQPKEQCGWFNIQEYALEAVRLKHIITQEKRL